MLNRNAALASAVAALIASSAAPALAAATGTTTVTHFQQEVSFDCGTANTCYGSFIDLPAKQGLDVEHVYCRLYVQKAAAPVEAYVYYDPEPTVHVPLARTWDGATITQKIYYFEVDTDLRVPLGGQLRVELTRNTGGSWGFGTCTAIGNRIVIS